jgi:hypothetical protein
MTWIPGVSDDGGDGDAVFGLQPDATRKLTEYLGVAESLAGGPLLDLIRLRIAQEIGYVPALEAADPDLLAALDDWEKVDRFGSPERAVLAYVEQFMVAPIDVSEDQRAALANGVGANASAFVDAMYINEAYLRFLTFFAIENEPTAVVEARAGAASGSLQASGNESVDGSYLSVTVEEQG